MKKVLFYCLAIFLLGISAASAQEDCFLVVAGRKTTADGCVLMGHNEDNGLAYVFRMRKVERAVHSPEEFVELAGGGRLAQADTTYAYLIFEMPGMHYSHSLLNEHGVAVVSNSCPSREDKPELTEGGIGPRLRILVAERARTAREGAKLVGSLVERFGYTASGRTLAICDTREAWLVAMVNGKHWVARRVPDDQVSVLANTYNIHEVDLGDTVNFMGSADLVDYAQRRGWYDPTKEGAFDFARAYAGQERLRDPDQFCRQWSGLRYFTTGIPPARPGVKLPFSVKPESRLEVKDIVAVLRDHYENTPFDLGKAAPHAVTFEDKARPICSAVTNYGEVYQLRSGMPVEIGALWWLAFWRPCSTPLLPFYYGVLDVPQELCFEVDPEVYSSPQSAAQPPMDKAIRVFKELSLFVDQDYRRRIKRVRTLWDAFEQQNFLLQKKVEAQALADWKKHRRLALEALPRYCQGTLVRAMQQAHTLLVENEAQ